MLRATDFFFFKSLSTVLCSRFFFLFFFAFNFDAGGFHERSQRMLQTRQYTCCIAKYDLVMKNKKQNTQPKPALNYLVVLLI